MQSEWLIRDQVLRKNLVPDTRAAAVSGNGTSIRHMCSNATGRLTLVSSAAAVTLVDTFRGYVVQEFKFDGRQIISAFFRDDNIVAVTSGGITYLDLKTGARTEKKLEDSVKAATCKEGTCVVLLENGEVRLLDLSVVKLPLRPEVAQFDGEFVAAADADRIGIFRTSGELVASAEHTAKLEELQHLNGKVVGRSTDSVVIWKNENGSLRQHTIMKDPITKSTFHAIAVFDFNNREYLAVSSRDEGKRCVLELFDLCSLATVRKWDMTRIGLVTGIFPTARGFFTALEGGAAVWWTTPKQDKADNWMTCIPNLESCFTNIAYEETENEFDFNVRKDSSVINRYKKSTSFFEFEPKGVTQAITQPVAATAEVLMDASRDDARGAAGKRESQYMCFQFSELFRSTLESINESPTFDGSIVYF